jgi:hypothetical protein
MAGRRTPAAPKGLGPRGRHFWRTVHAAYELEAHETELLVEAARTLDLVERLQATLDAANATGADGKPNAVLVELRQQRLTLARLLAALRIPDADSGERPQRRQIRGVYRGRTNRAGPLGVVG